MFTRTCALSDCPIEFQTDNPRKMHCSKQHTILDGVRRHRAKRRKGGGGGGGNGGGGGGVPTLFDTISPVDSRAAFVPIPVIGPNQPDRKPPEGARQQPQSRKAAA